MNNIDIIMRHQPEKILRLVLEELQPYQLASIRSKLSPHWTDGKYGEWSHNDNLFSVCFKDVGKKTITYRDGCGDLESGYVSHTRCLLCGEELINDKEFSDSRYSHLFSSCAVSARLRWAAKDEAEFRVKVAEFIKRESK